MYRSGHVGLSLLLYAPLVAVIGLFADWLLPIAILGGVFLADPFLVLVLLRKTMYSKVVFHLSRISTSLSTLPDVDRLIPGVTHRGKMHTIWFALLMGAATGATGFALAVALGQPLFPETGARLAAAALLSAYIGIHAGLTHLLGDILTPTGIQPFAPLSDRHYTADIVTADDPIANTGLLLSGASSFLIVVVSALSG